MEKVNIIYANTQQCNVEDKCCKGKNILNNLENWAAGERVSLVKDKDLI